MGRSMRTKWLLFKFELSWWWTSSLISSLANIANEYQCACDGDFQGVNCTEPLVTDPTNHFILALATFTLSIFLAVIVLTAYCLHQARNPAKSTPLIRPTCSTPLQVRLIRSEKRELALLRMPLNNTMRKQKALVDFNQIKDIIKSKNETNRGSFTPHN